MTGVRAAPPAQLELTWEVTREGSTIAHIVHKLDHGGGKYLISENWEGRGLFRLLGSVKRTSRGEAGPGGLRPLEYTDERSGRDTERATFDWKAQTATVQYQGPAKTIAFPAHPTDELAGLFGFSFAPPRENQILMDVINGRGISDRMFRNEGRERFKTAAGEFDALKLVRRKEGTERAEIWLAVDRGYLPVRILLVDKKGVRVDQVLTRLSGS